jgi:hypothetical protein
MLKAMTLFAFEQSPANLMILPDETMVWPRPVLA